MPTFTLCWNPAQLSNSAFDPIIFTFRILSLDNNLFGLATRESDFLAYKQKYADQPPHLRGVVSAFDIRYLERARYLLTYICKVSTLYPVCTFLV